MKHLTLLLFSVVALVTTVAAYVPTPEMAMSWKMGRDTRKWVIQYTAGNEQGIICEFTPEGQKIEEWQEMAAQQIAFVGVSLKKYFKAWKSAMVASEPKLKIAEKKLPDGSILATYESAAASELSVRRFIKAQDAIYMLAYHVRPQLKDEKIWTLWTEIVSDAGLVPNPEKRR